VLAALAIGFGAGVVSGLMGVGGGILFVPALVFFLDKAQLQAEATSLVAIIPVALLGAWRQYHYGNVRLADGIVIGVLSPGGVLAGAIIANTLSQRALEVGFSLLLVAVAASLVRRALREGDEGPAAPEVGGG
jgi:uncharacterized membrane protein YfcA